MCRSPWGRRLGQTDGLNRPCPIYHSLHIHATHCHQGAPGAPSTRSSLRKRKSGAQESHGAAPPAPIPTHPRTLAPICSLPPHFRSHFYPSRTHLPHSHTAASPRAEVPPPHHQYGRGAPPEVCTAPWRPPTQLESLGSPLPAGPPGSAGPAAAAAPHLPRVGRESSFRGTVRASPPVPESPRRPRLLLCSKACPQRGGGPDTMWWCPHGLQSPPQAIGLSLVIINHVFINSNITTTVIKN